MRTARENAVASFALCSSLRTRACELAIASLGQRHVDDLELQAIRPQEIDGVVAARTERILGGTVQHLGTQTSHQPVHGVDLLALFDIEGEGMEAGGIDLMRA